MNKNQESIDTYLSEFESYLIGSRQGKTRAKAELSQHLADAAEAGELRAALVRLGSPETAAIAFAQEQSWTAATAGNRLLAAAVDNLPLIALTLALLVQSIQQGGQTITVAFPPFVYIELGNACIAPIPFTVCGVYNGGLLYAVGLPLALLWSIVGLALWESRRGDTPGKRLMRLQLVGENGIRAKLPAAIMRRLSFLAGPLAWIDWAPVLWGERQRILDRFAGTKVVVIAPVGKSTKPGMPLDQRLEEANNR